jgi:hypothetical protein
LIEDVDLTLEIIFFAERNQNRPGVGAELLTHAINGAIEVRADTVHLIHERDARHPVFRGLAPDGLRLRLDAGNTTKDGDGAIQDAERTLDLGGKIDMAGSVDDVYPLFNAFEDFVNPVLLALDPRACRRR